MKKRISDVAIFEKEIRKKRKNGIAVFVAYLIHLDEVVLPEDSIGMLGSFFCSEYS